MPCFNPLQAVYSVDSNGVRKPKILPTNLKAREMQTAALSKFKDSQFIDWHKSCDSDYLQLPCGRCMGCRLEKSRQTALRCVHESRMCEDNCFITLTISDSYLPIICPLTEGGYSLVRKHTQDFMKRLRERFDEKKIRVFGCGEYGDKLGRPHYHFCLFGVDFPDKKKWAKVNNFWHYNSDILSELWPYGHATIGDFSFETAAYVARYCTKKVTGSKAEAHYKGRLPEFPIYSLKPGLGKPWFDSFGESDIFPHDSCVSRGVECKVPRYYDKLREREDPKGFAQAKELRRESATEKSQDNTSARLLDKEKCMNARVKLLVRKLEKNE